SNAEAISGLEKCLNATFAEVAEAVVQSQGHLLVTGIGKAGLIGAKISSTFSATGTPSLFLHPVEALHGDLGRVQEQDLVLILSNSGASEEILRLLDPIKTRGAKVIGLTGEEESPLAQEADWVVCFGKVSEASPMALVPSAAISCMQVLGDALALEVMHLRKFSIDEMAVLHPSGSLGKKMLKVEEVMGFRRGENLPVASDTLTVREVLQEVSGIKRRCGAVLLVDREDKLSGIFTDGDLRRLFEKGNEGQLDRTISEFMIKNPKSIPAGAHAAEALEMIHLYRIDEIPVLDSEGRPIGLIDIQDVS
ncbi:MAG: KpsF/GutQ family sugar-phosphate isomerase, partial [bacterium]|nr:KpsF/GutQ family sugar-phosphate isomerase [bacterium]